jgi:hypothetical protein
MAEITRAKAQVSLVYPTKAEIMDVILTEAVEAGQPLYQLSTGKFGLADANGAGKQQIRGLALKSGAAGQAVSMLKKGHVAGFAVSGMNADAAVYLSDTVGELADGAGTMTVNCGRVTVLTDSTPTKVLYFEADWLRAWS